MSQIYKDEENLIIKIPLISQRFSPWSDEPQGDMDNIIGVIEGDECGFAYLIDMSYKGKSDQISEMFYKCDYGDTKFKELCKELEIEVFEYPTCSECGEVIYGTYTYSSRGPICWQCNKD